MENFPIEYNVQLERSLMSIVFNPVFWNIAAQLEYHTGLLSKVFRGKRRGCYALGATIFTLGLVRDFLYKSALDTQPVSPLLDNPWVIMAGFGLFAIGNTLVLSSLWQLGITGTYLGDYFGILMKERVTAFPFNVTDNPMYMGSYLSFMGTALFYGKSAGILLSCAVWLMYRLALKVEEPFTTKIYSGKSASIRDELSKKLKDD